MPQFCSIYITFPRLQCQGQSTVCIYMYVCTHSLTVYSMCIYVCMYVRLHMYVYISTYMCTSLYSITYPYTHMHVIYTRYPNFLATKFYHTSENVTENVTENFAENVVENVSENMLQCRQCYQKLPIKITVIRVT